MMSATIGATEFITYKSSFMVNRCIIENDFLSTVGANEHIAPNNIINLSLETIRILSFI